MRMVRYVRLYRMVDQMGIGEDHYFIQRSHIGLTPVLNLPWTWLP